MDDKVTTFSHWLRYSGMSVRSLAEVLGVSRASVYKWLAGEMLPTASNLVKLEALSKGAVTARSFTRQVGGPNDSEM
jgi:predicted transcriptional regulator